MRSFLTKLRGDLTTEQVILRKRTAIDSITGFRNGIKWLFIASIQSLPIFGIIVFSTGYWQQNQLLAIALALALLAIPAYCATLTYPQGQCPPRRNIIGHALHAKARIGGG